MTWTTILNMCSLSVSVLVRDIFVYQAKRLLILWLDRKSEDVTPYIDIKSEWLRDILRDVLQNIKVVGLMEDKPWGN